jgi:argininosuccinate lyase
MKLWHKDGFSTDKKIEQFTIGKDAELDLQLAKWDVLGNLAHAQMLTSINLIPADEWPLLQKELQHIYAEIELGNFEIEPGVEDVHSQVELMLTRKLGDIGKKVHSGRSRNDQVLVDLKLFFRAQMETIVGATVALFTTLQTQSEKYKSVLIPGYTHLQIAMPSSFGLWFGAYAEALTDDLQLLLAAYRINNQNPLGSAAGYGNSFPLDRQLTSDLLAFDNPNYNVIYAQMGRGKVEKTIAFALASLGSTLARLSMDVTIFMSQNFDFLTFPKEFTTGSSIMPHKKNPDVFELIRAKGNRLQSLPNELALITTNLPSGYFRDMQILKECIFPAFTDMLDMLDLAKLMFENVIVREGVVEDPRYKYIFSVEEVNKLVLAGTPFRDAYKQVGEAIERGEFSPSTTVNHTHLGSIGNLATEQIAAKLQTIVGQFDFEKIEAQLGTLLK